MSKCYYILDTRGEVLTAPCLGYLSAHHDGHLFEPISLCSHTDSCDSVRLSTYKHISMRFQEIRLFLSFSKWENGGSEKWYSMSKVKFEPSSDGPRTLSLWATEVSRQRNSSLCCPQIMYSALTLEKMKSCPFWKGMLRRWKYTVQRRKAMGHLHHSTW